MLKASAKALTRQRKACEDHGFVELLVLPLKIQASVFGLYFHLPSVSGDNYGVRCRLQYMFMFSSVPTTTANIVVLFCVAREMPFW